MLELERIGLTRPGFSLELDLALPAGEYGVLLGPSGCGKSTALRIVAGLLAQDSGTVRLGGRLLDGLPPERRRVGMVFQDYALFPQLSVRRNIEYGPALAGEAKADRRRRGESLAAMFQLTRLLERKPGTLSGGEQQRVALARSLAAGPELLLLDEPLSSLDAALRRDLRGEIRERVREAGLTALHVTHDLEEALALADRLFLMRDGRLVEAGRPEELYAAPRRAYTARFLGRGPLLEARRHAVREGLATAETAFGRLACPLDAATLGGSRADAAEGAGVCAGSRAGDKGYFHFAAADPRPLAAGESAPDGANLLEGRVLATSFLGRARRLLLEPIGAAGADNQGSATAIEIEVEASFHPQRGERLRLAIPYERCMLIGD